MLDMKSFEISNRNIWELGMKQTLSLEFSAKQNTVVCFVPGFSPDRALGRGDAVYAPSVNL